MASQGRPLPKFGEWDVNNPASAEGFTVIFNKARDAKKTRNTNVKILTPKKIDSPSRDKDEQHHPKKTYILDWFRCGAGRYKKWFCCGR